MPCIRLKVRIHILVQLICYEESRLPEERSAFAFEHMFLFSRFLTLLLLLFLCLLLPFLSLLLSTRARYSASDTHFVRGIPVLCSPYYKVVVCVSERKSFNRSIAIDRLIRSTYIIDIKILIFHLLHIYIYISSKFPQY